MLLGAIPSYALAHGGEIFLVSVIPLFAFFIFFLGWHRPWRRKLPAMLLYYFSIYGAWSLFDRSGVWTSLPHLAVYFAFGLLLLPIILLALIVLVLNRLSKGDGHA